MTALTAAVQARQPVISNTQLSTLLVAGVIGMGIVCLLIVAYHLVRAVYVTSQGGGRR